MNKSILILAIILLSFNTGCNSEKNKAPKKGVILEKRELTLTIGASEKLGYTLTKEAENERLIWESSDPAVASVSVDGTITAINFKGNSSSTFVKDVATGSADITVKTENNKFKDTIKITTTTKPLVNMINLPPLKDQFSSYFMIGNIFNPQDAITDPFEIDDDRLVRHYNILTPENNMKPGYLAPTKDKYDFATADRMVNAALASGFKVHGHVLLWHAQNAGWMNGMANESRSVALAAMKKYITDVVTHFKGRLYSWDILNEVFPDGVSGNADWTQVMRKKGDSQGANPWYVSIGADFVYEGFLAARLADPDLILYYNDYNTDQTGKATMIHNMVRDVNARYQREYPNANRLLIEGIGMQEHHNTGVSAASISRAIDLFRPLGVRISVAELDVLAQSWSDFSSSGGAGTDKHRSSTVTNNGIRTQARLYGEYIKLYMENADIIERVSWWGITDDRSWRSAGLPLLFDHNDRAKPAYYSVVAQLN